MVLSGVEGTGKPTLLCALSIAAAALLHRMLPITHTYDVTRCDSSPAALLAVPAVAGMAAGLAFAASAPTAAPAAGAGAAPVPTSVEEALGQLRAAAGTTDLDVFLVLDEL